MTENNTALPEPGAIRTGGQILMAALRRNGVDRVFGVPGESFLAALDACRDHGEALRFITCRHEAPASVMAEAAGKLTGRPGVCFVTRGPGATHATTGLHTAFQDSTPMLLLIGQVARDQMDREAFQEIDYRRFLEQVTKWTAEVPSADRLGEYVGRALRTAMAGRPGPVALALPEDMLSETAPMPRLKPAEPAPAHAGQDQMERLVAALDEAERPFLLVGGSGWTAAARTALQDFAERNHLPVAVSFRCQDRLDSTSPAYVGDMGIGANPALVQRMQQSDLLLALGPRLGEMTTGGYRRLVPPVLDQPFIHVHQGAEELGRVYQPDLAIQASPATLLPALDSVTLTPSRARARWCQTARADLDAWRRPVDNPGTVKLARFWAELGDHIPAETIICNGAGNYAAWLHRFYRYRGGVSQLAPTSGAMGYGVPAAISAALHHGDRPVIAAAGDGCFMMSAMELATAAAHRLTILFLVFDNGQYGTIRMHQEAHYPGRISATGLTNPDFVAFAESFAISAEKVADTDGLLNAVDRWQDRGGPHLIHIPVDPRAIAPGKTL
ncbi:thiamine pyrophosphate-binding protein [Yunchengibacter salinarum]|uniref:thiamine pyrophosphate-binding protein n=1 Tax=Yunchengibacter salinarum TaxID=3133399 RepID=UPI0035B6688A